MNNLYREPSQVSVHLAKRFQRRRFFRNRPIRNKNCLGQPCLLMDRDELSNHNRGLSINASHQVSVHLAKRFQRRRFKKKSANQKQELPFSIQSCRSCYATLHLCQCQFYNIFVKFRNSKKNVLKIVLIIVNINKDENKSLISNQISLKNDLLSFLTFYLCKIVLQEMGVNNLR